VCYRHGRGAWKRWKPWSSRERESPVVERAAPQVVPVGGTGIYREIGELKRTVVGLSAATHVLHSELDNQTKGEKPGVRQMIEDLDHGLPAIHAAIIAPPWLGSLGIAIAYAHAQSIMAGSRIEEPLRSMWIACMTGPDSSLRPDNTITTTGGWIYTQRGTAVVRQEYACFCVNSSRKDETTNIGHWNCDAPSTLSFNYYTPYSRPYMKNGHITILTLPWKHTRGTESVDDNSVRWVNFSSAEGVPQWISSQLHLHTVTRSNYVYNKGTYQIYNQGFGWHMIDAEYIEPPAPAEGGTPGEAA
jgi:hypothetical protein